ncbi:hypothetical protein KIW84_012917 [Lathyrus oleraceus]|uniref:Uncharacterized protein n=1 Tax=Pisum sativum TaxID=3888 RepID=A0A9D5GWZ7_PEA|nr:hypothetical protein KIW84_012917 [Pisum sativum]
MHGMSVRDDGYLRNSNHASNVPLRKPSKLEDKSFGDLVNIEKVKPKPTSGHAGSILEATPEGVEDQEKLARVAAFPIGIGSE